MFPLPIRVRIAPGADLTANPATWTWTDITEYARAKIVITRGRPDESGQAPPGSCRLRVDNAGGRFVARNPLSPWYPTLRRNCPLRVEVQIGGVWYIRSTTYINELPPTLVPGSTDTYVDLVASGITRRLGQGTAPVSSTPARYIPTTNPLAYWSLEDGQLTSEGAAQAGGYAMRPFIGAHPAGNVITAVQWGRGDLAPWLPGAVSRSGSAGLTAIWAPVNMTPFPTRWTVDFMFRSGTGAADGAVDVNPSYLGGSLGWPQLLLLPSVRGVDVAMNGEPEVNGTAATLYDGTPHHVRWDVTQSGAKVAWVVYVDGTSVNSGTTSGNMTVPSVNALSFVADAQNGAEMVQGHIGLWTSPPSLSDAVAAAFGYVGETAATRMVRLCAEAGVPFVVVGSDSEPMGPQAPAPLLTLLREAEETDGGVLFERLDGRLGYLRRFDRYNRSVALALTYGQLADPFQPNDDDRLVRNDVTVTRAGGTSAQVVDQAHINAEGRYDHQATVNTATDDVLPNHAGWRVHLGTVDELRHPQLTLNLRNPRVDDDVVDAWLAADIASRLSVTDLPPGLAITEIDQLIEGYSETIDRVEWSAVLNCSPASGWDVATADGEQRAPADGSSLASNLGTDSPDAPVNSNPYFETNAADWTGSGGAVARSTAQSHEGAASLLLTPDGVSAVAEARNALVPAVAGVTYWAKTWVRCAVARSVSIDIDAYTAATAFISTSSSAVAVPANTWTEITTAFMAPPTTAQARIVVGMSGSPAGSHLLYIDEATIGRAVNMVLSSTPENGVWTEDPSDFPLDVRVGGEQVTASAIAPATVDPFTRSAAGFGTAPTGQVWTTSGGSAGDYTTDTARGVMSQGTVNVLRTALLDVGGPDQTFEIDTTLVPTPTGAASTYWVLGRVIDLNNHYLTRLDVAPGGGTQLLIYKRGGGTLTLIAGPLSLSPNIGGTWRIGLSVSGTAGLAQLRAKAYRFGAEQDPGWILSGTDNGALSTATTATQLGVAARLESGNTLALPVLARWDNLLVTVPQVVTLSARGVNGIQRAWPAGSEVDVWLPAISAL